MLLLLTSVGAATTLAHHRTYQSESSVLLLASRSAARLNGGNPYLSFSPSLTLTADAVSREIMAPSMSQDLAARGFLDSYTVALAPYTTNTTGSVLLVTVTGSDKVAVEQTLQAVTSEVGAELQQLQSRNGVAARNRIRAVTISYAARPALSSSLTARPVAIVIVLGLLLTLWLPLLADGLVARRRIRRYGEVLPEGPAGPVTAGQLSSSGSQNGNGRPATGARRR